MYVISPFIGLSQAITLNTGITFISDVVGLKGANGAFVFGFYSFMDKICSGIVLFFLTNNDLTDIDYVRTITSFVPLTSAVVSWILVIISFKKIGNENESDK